jgi:3-deoxy-D-manno-octulosonic-acid transferase
MGPFYRIAVALALGAAAPFLLVARGGRYRATLAGRMGRFAGEPVRGALWIHAVSVGEVGVAATLARALPADLPLLVTTVTPTGQERARALFAGRAAVAYLPFELAGPVERFLDRFAPAALVLCEGDYWPLLLDRARRRGIPVAVVNGRVSDRSFPRLLRFRGWVRRNLLDPVERFGLQTAADRDRLLALGVAPSRAAVTGNLKFETPEPPRRPEVEARIGGLAAGRPVWIAGSTMAGEEEAVLDAFAAAGGGERALLVLAPRHPERFPAVAELLAGRSVRHQRRSAAEAPAAGAATDVLLLDTLGELASVYRLGQIAFIGGTLVPKGGHNPLEAARFGVPVVVGPSMENFREIADFFDGAAAWRRAADAGELGRVFDGLAADPAGARALGERGRALIEANRGALARTLELVAPLVARVAGGAP